MIGDWPGSFGLLTDPARSAIADSIDITMYPEGPAGFRRVYSGSHSFAITRGCRDTDAARELLLTLTGIEAQLIEGRRGSVPTRRDVASILQAEATTPFERKRLALLGETIVSDMISFPPLASYPRIEEIAWPALSAALHDQVSVASALTTAHRQVNDDLQIGREFARRPTS